MKTLIPLSFALVSALLLSTACDSGGGEDITEETRDQTLLPEVIPGGDPQGPGGNGNSNGSGGVVTLPNKPIALRPLATRSSEEFCVALGEFLQNYAATRLEGVSLSLLKEPVKTCRLDSHASNISLHTSLLLSKAQNSLSLSINIVMDYEQNTFTSARIFVDRLGTRHEPFVASDRDRVFGDLTRFSSELRAFAQLNGAEYRIFGQAATLARALIENNHAAGNQRFFLVSPRLRLELNGGRARIVDIDASYFRSAISPGTYLRCATLACLQSGLSYEFVGNDLVLYSKPYLGANNQSLKANVRLSLESFQIR